MLDFSLVHLNYNRITTKPQHQTLTLGNQMHDQTFPAL
jgi:hypothetical protein